MDSETINNEIELQCQLLFSGSVKKLSQRGFWQHRIITLDSRGNIYISAKGMSSFQENNKKLKTPINITQSGIVRRQGRASDGRWPSRLDLRQSLVLECSTTKFLFFPSIRAAEALTTQLDILCCKKRSEEKTDSSTESDTVTEVGRDTETDCGDKMDSRCKRLSQETDEELTLPNRNLGYEIEPNEEVELCIDFTSGPGYLACKRTKQTLRNIPDNTATTHTSARVSLSFPNTQFTPKPILKRRSESNSFDQDKTDTLSRVRINTSPSVRIVSVMSNTDTQEAETDYVFHCINKYVVSNRKKAFQTEKRERNTRLSLMFHKIMK